MEITAASRQLNTPDGKMELYEARPKDGGPYPAIIVLQEAFGLNPHIKDITERVAREGYVAASPELYYREPERVFAYTDLQKAMPVMNRLQDPKVMADIGAAIGHLKSQSTVKSGSIGMTGFCLGGRYAYLTAAHYNKDIKAAVCFYGGGIPMGNPSPLSRTGEIQCPIYLFFGAKDALIPQEHVEQVKKALTDHKKNFQLHIYPDVGHGFVCDARPSYNPEAAKDAWEKFKVFFARHLK